jgi:hypothetical protein
VSESPVAKEHVDALLHLPRKLNVAHDVLGMTIPVVIEGSPGRLALPRAPEITEVDFVELREPSFGTKSRGLSALVTGTLRLGSGVWGSFHVKPPMAQVDACRLRIRVPAGPPAHDSLWHLDNDFLRWFDLFLDWYCLLTQATRRYPAYDGPTSSVIHARMQGDGGPGLFGSGVTVSTMHLSPAYAARDQIIAATTCANLGRHLLPEHTLIERAVSNNVAGDYRQAVIDSCTASEVAVAAATTRLAQSTGGPAEVTEGAFKGSSGIVDLFRFYNFLGGRPPVSNAKVLDQLAGPRNLAAHKATPMTVDHAKRALSTPGPSFTTRRPSRPHRTFASLDHRSPRSPTTPSHASDD